LIALVRVDNRLVHGQVVEAWLPHLKVARVVVADDESAKSPLVRAAMALAVQDNVQVQILPLSEVDFAALALDEPRTLLLLRDVNALVGAVARGLRPERVNLGNVHFGTGRKLVTASVFLTDAEAEVLAQLETSGIDVEVRAVPTDKPMTMADIVERFRKAGG
jgi:mannose/fructose/N-acetylgalactosamine-specific phosphotransferase system component IIB